MSDAKKDSMTLTAPLTFLGLPVELLIQIFSHLEISDLNNIGDTCQHLNHIINDEELWKNLFKERYHTKAFSSVSKSFKFSTELFARNEKIHKWRKASGIHRILTINNGCEKLVFTYPKVLSFNDQGSIDMLSVDKSKSETSIPVTTPSSCSAHSMNTSASVFGRFDGKVFGKLLASKSYLSSITKFDKEHEAAVLSIHNDDSNCYSGDEKGSVFLWDLKNGVFMKEYQVSTKAITMIHGFNETIVACDDTDIFILEAGKVRSITHSKTIRSLFVDYGGKTIVLTDLMSVTLYSFHTSTFGRHSTLELSDEIECVSLEDKCLKNRDTRIAGYDGCNLGIVTTIGEVLIVNIRNVHLNSMNEIVPLLRFEPLFDDLRKPNSWPAICSIAVNSAVVLLGSYNGYAAVFDVLTGEFLRMVSGRIPKRYLLLTEENSLFPVESVLLGERDETHGVLLVNNVVQYFQFGELIQKYDSKKSKKKLVGTSSDRKDKIKKKIKHEIDEMDHQEFEQYKAEKLLNKYNGDELDEDEQIQLAMVLNKSLNEKERQLRTSKENEDPVDGIDEDLAKALELSRLESEPNISECQVFNGPNEGSTFATVGHQRTTDSYDDDLVTALKLSRAENGEPHVGSSSHYTEQERSPLEDIEDDFETQLKEAMRRSLYE